ncbi:MAG: RNA-binding protein [Candidatus Harrisonbacteria bacterium CG10_big_fil_rev_8_21_14_0_10_49_15]|uniref:RNA-binding protein KhpA n=1 Tax=Candidatus Harrisonbacteria bacterium CG10_big_fil_rev_8_21_14_0_10_49_15 TaxID=1974587 RepID=A0A2H0UL76_9BACT|nr:MAG: RNA-binding protein [Candidatus Harrisonbacteria bacterium CG10_big_fil_rev_8_21_14_0_10_49_15]
MSETQVDQEFLEFVVKGIVDHPESVTVERQVDDMGVLLRLRVHAEDMGQVVGRQGATAKAIRSLLRIVGIKHNARVNLKIEEPEGSTHVPRPAADRVAEPSATPAAASDTDFGPIADELAL